MIYSLIEWCHHTANLWWGCTWVQAGCDNCFACALAKRYKHDVWGNDKPRKIVDSVWKNLLLFQKLAEEAGEIHRVFVGSMMDIFEKPMPLVDWHGNPLPYTTDALRQQLFNNISEGMYPNLDFLFLTKRPSNINRFIPEKWKINPPGNVMFGTSIVDQATADRYIPMLLLVNGRRFLSLEPQLGPVVLTQFFQIGGIDWLIQGGESGHHRRPFDLIWARQMAADCKAYGVPYFFKQIDKVQQIPAHMLIREFPALPQLAAD